MNPLNPTVNLLEVHDLDINEFLQKSLQPSNNALLKLNVLVELNLWDKYLLLLKVVVLDARDL